MLATNPRPIAKINVTEDNTLEDNLIYWFGQKYISEKYIAENPYSEKANGRLYHCVNMCFRLKFQIEKIGFSPEFESSLDDFLNNLEKALG